MKLEVQMKYKWDNSIYTGENAILIYVSLFKFLLLVLFAGNYGLFRDELYYIECSKHLSWGYVDQPPFSILMLAISRKLFGESILGIRVFAYLAGSATVFISGLMVRELGGKKFAQVFTTIAVIFSGVILGTSNYFSMNSFDIFFASLMFYILIRIVKEDNRKLWIILGIVLGIGLENKFTFLFLGFGLLVGLILTKQRKNFLYKEIYICAAIALLLFLPHLIWQVLNHFPTLEFMQNAATRKNSHLGFVGFFTGSIMELNPFYTIFLITAGYFLFLNKEGKRFSIIGWMFISIFIVFVLNNGKPYYMGVLFPVMIAAGVTGADSLIIRYIKNWGRYVLILLLIPSIVLVTPFAIPILNVDTFISFSEYLGIKPASGERSRLGILPQFYADRFGWKEMVEDVRDVYNKLSDKEKKQVVIFGQNYGEASAVNIYGKEYGLPTAISSHNSFWFWGYPKDYTGEMMIVIGSNIKDNKVFFEQVELAAVHENKYGMPFENVNIYLCRKVKMPMNEMWNKIKNFI
jgi:hypothetical protein